MSSSTSGLSNTAETGVFWDLDDCPIPDDQTPASVCANIKSALKTAGYVGRVSIVAYSLTKQTSVDFESAQIKLEQPGDYNEKLHTISGDVFMWAMTHLYVPTNLLIISEDFDYADVLMIIKKQHNNIILAFPHDTPSEMLRSTASSLWLWADLSAGGSPRNCKSGSVQVSLPPTKKKKQMKLGLKPCQKKRKSSSNTKLEN
ncbi:unnamed protein product [Arabidopsis lyrata]|nr:unnamed protein product [Arabidopsis lyrata]